MTDFTLPFHPTHVAIHYNEVALKGKNRAWFEEVLARNIRAAVGTQNRVERLYGRLLLRLGEETPWPVAASRLARVFGIAYVLPVLRVEPDLESLKHSADVVLSGIAAAPSFAVHCKRSTKDFPFTSMDVEREVGAHVAGRTGWPVDLDCPAVTLRIELVNGVALMGAARFPGPGGLPTGVAGRVVCLLSGGIDSPVAAYRVLRRGATCVHAHFHSHPHTGIESQEKARELAERIQPLGRRTRLYLIPFAELQRRIVSACPAPLRVVLYRRFMLRAAEALARKERALALVTGENLGQVASQTLENLRAIEAAVTLPVLRPLIGLDKVEIIAEARAVGTYEVSIEPHGDCCSFLMPPNPATRSTPEELDRAEAPFDVPAEVTSLVEQSQMVEIGAAAGSLSGETD